MNIFRYLYRLSPKLADEVVASAGSGSLPDGYVTDGEGGIYEIPKTGTTTLVSLDDIKDVKFRYNWKTREVEVYVRDRSEEIDTNNYVLLTSMPLSAGDFIDGPEYWFRNALDTVEDEANYAIQTAEAYELYGEVIDDDRENYKYQILFSYDFLETDSRALPLSSWDTEKFYDKLEKFLCNYDIKTTLYTQELKVKAQPDENSGYLCLVVDFPMPLTKEELMDIWYNYEEYITDAGDKFNLVLTLNIENIVEL